MDGSAEPDIPPTEPAASPLHLLRQSFDRARIETFALGLDAMALESHIVRGEGEWQLLVHARDLAAARRALEGFDAEVEAQAIVRLPAPRQPASLLGVAWLGLLVAAYLITGPVDPASPWYARGAAISTALLRGQSFRDVTALLLHQHFAHLLGNAALALVLGAAVGQVFGGGVGALLVLATGAAGNALTAAWVGPGHSSIGASTAVFGALGLLTATRREGSRWPAWVPIAASLALLGMLGTDKHADIHAHLFGWLSGVLLGLLAGLLQRSTDLAGRSRTAAQWGSGLVAAGIIASAWLVAWR